MVQRPSNTFDEKFVYPSSFLTIFYFPFIGYLAMCPHNILASANTSIDSASSLLIQSSHTQKTISFILFYYLKKITIKLVICSLDLKKILRGKKTYLFQPPNVHRLKVLVQQGEKINYDHALIDHAPPRYIFSRALKNMKTLRSTDSYLSHTHTLTLTECQLVSWYAAETSCGHTNEFCEGQNLEFGKCNFVSNIASNLF